MNVPVQAFEMISLARAARPFRPESGRQASSLQTIERHKGKRGDSKEQVGREIRKKG